MQILSILLAQLAVAPTIAAPVVLPDTTIPRAEAAAAETLAAPVITIDFGKGAGAPLVVKSVEFELAATAGTSSTASASGSRDKAAAAARVKVVRIPDSLSGQLAARVASGEPIAAMDLRLPGGGGAPALLLHLADVRVASTRLTMTGDTLGLTQQRLGIEESITQLTADLAEARRQYGVAESLEKQRLSASLDLARARGTVDALSRRLASQEERKALIRRQIESWAPVQEELVLTAAHADVRAAAP